MGSIPTTRLGSKPFTATVTLVALICKGIVNPHHRSVAIPHRSKNSIFQKKLSKPSPSSPRHQKNKPVSRYTRRLIDRHPYPGLGESPKPNLLLEEPYR